MPFVVSAQNGIDVSRFQDTINWKKVANSKKIEFVYIKASEGASIRDKMYRYNAKKASDAGLKVGSYHVYSSTTTAKQQFTNFKKAVGKTKQDIVPVLDIEAVHCHKLYMARVDMLLDLMEKEYGAKPMIYTSEKLYLTHFNIKKYKKYHFFIANYKREPKMAYTLWQYTPRGKQKGINGFVDFSRFSSRYDIKAITIPDKDSTAVQDTVKTKKPTKASTPKKQQTKPANKKSKPAAKPAKKTTAKPAQKPAAKPAAKTKTKQTAKPTSKPKPKQTTKPTSKPKK